MDAPSDASAGGAHTARVLRHLDANRGRAAEQAAVIGTAASSAVQQLCECDSGHALSDALRTTENQAGRERAANPARASSSQMLACPTMSLNGMGCSADRTTCG